MKTAYLKMASGVSFPALGATPLETTFDRTKALVIVDKSSAGGERDRMASRHQDYDWVVAPVQQEPNSDGFVVMGHLIPKVGR